MTTTTTRVGDEAGSASGSGARRSGRSRRKRRSRSSGTEARGGSGSGSLFVRIRRTLLSRETFDTFTVFVAMCCLLYELPASVVVSLQDNLRAGISEGFIRYRLLFSAFAIGCCALNLLLNRREFLRVRSTWLYAGFIAYMAGIVFWHADLLAYSSAGDEYQSSAPEVFLPIFFKYVLYCLLGMYLVELQRWRWLMLIALTAAMISILPYVSFESFSIDRSLYADDASGGNYQFIGDAIALCALLVIAWFPGFRFRLFYVLFTLTILFFVGSRASFVVFAISIIAYILLSFRVRWIASYLAVVCIGVVITSNVDMEEIAEQNPRMFYIFTEYEDDASVQERANQSAFGWEDIRDNPLLGKFGGQLEYAEAGTRQNWRSYMHDVFSYWRQFGLAAIAVWALFAAQFAYRLVRQFSNRASVSYAVCMLPGTFLLLSAVIGRSFAFANAHMLFGITLVLLAGHVMGNVGAVESGRRKRGNRQRKKAASRFQSNGKPHLRF